MTMRVKITNEDTSPHLRCRVTPVFGSGHLGQAVDLAPSETREFYVYKGCELKVEEVVVDTSVGDPT